MTRDITGEASSIDRLLFRFKQQYQRYEDAVVPHRPVRWAALGLLLLFFFIRVISYGGFYVVTYGMCIHLLYLLILMITPLSDPEENGLSTDEARLPSGGGDKGEFKPFIPKVQEFVVWRSMIKVVLICFVLTWFSVFDIPVFWPILVLYFIVLFVSQMGHRVKHMLKHKYVPWSAGKPKYVSKD
jgi:hypothetical protein